VSNANPDKLRRALGALLVQAENAAWLTSRGRAAFDEDLTVRWAAEALLIRVGECVGRIDHADVEFSGNHPELKLHAVKNMRNLVAHDYEMVDYQLVWDALTLKLPRLAAEVRSILGRV
jgi:uncharacterized protein with HEPN domain